MFWSSFEQFQSYKGLRVQGLGLGLVRGFRSIRVSASVGSYVESIGLEFWSLGFGLQGEWRSWVSGSEALRV